MGAPVTRPFADVVVVPAAEDNAAAATRRIEAGAAVALPGGPVVLPHTVPEGHRFAVVAVPGVTGWCPPRYAPPMPVSG